jgi:phosphogluconate dehydratase
MKLHPVVEQVTERIRQRSAASRSAYLAQVKAAAHRDRGADRMGCANVAHALAAMPEPDKAMAMPRYVNTSALPANDKFKVVAEKAPNIAIVNAYNDMLSAHAPLAGFPSIIKDELRKHGATAQVAGGVPAMCDGVTQGTAGMELSLFSRDNIAQGTAIALSHDVFDGALMLGVCDKIVPGLLIGALHFGHLPTVFVPAGPMTSGLSNNEKAKVREQAAQGLVGRAQLLAAESKAYHGPGTCTFYGTANSNQMLLEAMGLHVPGTAFVNPDEATGSNFRELLTREAARTALAAVKSAKRMGELVDERCIVNAMVALLATGGSTNHLIHWVAVARAAGIVIDWNDFSQLSDCVPLLSRVYPNGSADVNQFQAAGGPGYVIRELLDAGFMHADVVTVSSSLREFTKIPSALEGNLTWNDAGASKDLSVVRPASEPFSATGGLKLLQGNLGRSVIKVSAVPEDRHIIEAPAKVFDSQEAMLAAFKAGEMEKDMVVVVRWQGPRANGMPELHKLTPPLAVLQGKGFKVALVTDGRMSGASGKVPAAIHVSPEALAGGSLAKLRDGDMVRLDAVAGTLQALVSDAEWAARPLAQMPANLTQSNGIGMGRELFASSRRNASTAEEGACSWL